MRRLIDVLLAVMLLGILGGAVLFVQRDRTEVALRDSAREETRRFQQQIALQSALEQGRLNERGFPGTVDPAWFNGNPPDNPLLPPTHPWVEIALPAHQGAPHPPDPVALEPAAARFWYNPRLGVIRARVPMCLSDSATLELYNHVNDSALSDLFPTAKAAAAH